jgi:hypothetical protein
VAGADVVVRFTADTKQLDKAMGQVESTGSRLAGVGKSIAGALGGAAIIGAIVKTTQAASDLNESVAASEAIFGKSQKAIAKWASGAAQDFGQSKQQALEAATGFGNMFQQLGIGEAPTVKMSRRMVELASDFASFRNADVTDVLEAQQAAFRGEYDALQKFVPTINAAAVETEALAETGKANAKELTAQEKATATYTLMLQGAGKAMGDFDRTADGAANQQRIFQAQMKDLQATIGQALLPVLVEVLGILSKVATAFMDLPGPVQSAIVVLGLFAASWAVLEALSIPSAIASTVRALPDIISGFATAAKNVVIFIDQLTSLSTVAGGAGLGLLLLAAYMLRFKTETEKAAEAGKRQAESMVENITTGTTAATSLQELTRSQGVLTAKLAEAREMYDQYSAAATGSLKAQDDLGVNARGAAEKAHELGVEVANLEAKHGVYAEAIRRAHHEVKIARLEEQARVESLAAMNAGIEQSTEDTLANISAMQQYANQMLAMQGGPIAVEAANINLARAYEHLAELEKSGTASALDLAAAHNQVNSATLAVSAAAIKATADHDAFEASISQKSVPALEAQKQALEESKTAYGANSDAINWQIGIIDAYIAKANDVPPAAVTIVRFDNTEALSRMADYKWQLDHLPKDVRTEALIAISVATTGYNPPGFAAGGVVPGPKGAPLLAVVHGGETVIPVQSAARSSTMTSSGVGGSSPTFNIKIDVASGVPPAQVGAAVVDQIRAYERQNGKSWRAS